MGEALNRAEIVAKVEETIIDVLDIDDLSINESTTADEVEGWDSLSHLRLVVQIESVFGIRFATIEIESFQTVGDMVSAIEVKLGNR